MILPILTKISTDDIDVFILSVFNTVNCIVYNILVCNVYDDKIYFVISLLVDKIFNCCILLLNIFHV